MQGDVCDQEEKYSVPPRPAPALPQCGGCVEQGSQGVVMLRPLLGMPGPSLCAPAGDPTVSNSLPLLPFPPPAPRRPHLLLSGLFLFLLYTVSKMGSSVDLGMSTPALLGHPIRGPGCLGMKSRILGTAKASTVFPICSPAHALGWSHTVLRTGRAFPGVSGLVLDTCSHLCCLSFSTCLPGSPPSGSGSVRHLMEAGMSHDCPGDAAAAVLGSHAWEAAGVRDRSGQGHWFFRSLASSELPAPEGMARGCSIPLSPALVLSKRGR